VVYDILDDVIKDHPVLLNRAPTLHRLGVQAFMPKLVEGKAIRLHPLACAAFNADFDGDQMAVHVPLSIEARLESKMLMLAENNILAPANGKPIATPSQDIVLGCFYLTKMRHNSMKGDYRELWRGPDGKRLSLNRPDLERARLAPDFATKYKLVGKQGVYSTPEEAVMAYEHGRLSLHAEILVRFPNYMGRNEARMAFTSVGRLIFRNALPKQMDFLEVANEVMTKKVLGQVVGVAHKQHGPKACAEVLDNIKNLGFQFAKAGGISICIQDMIIPESKPGILKLAQDRLGRINKDYSSGNLTDEERYHNVISTWTQATDEVTRDLMKSLSEDQDGLNPIYIMAHSGARGNKDQIRQLAGMRGLMQRPSKKLTGSIGEIIESPILASFREGLTVLEYFISTHGARKGLADTALKTSDAGYLTRRLVDVAQDLIITEDDCGTQNGIMARPITDVDAKGEKILEPLRERITGRCPVFDVKHPNTGAMILKARRTDHRAHRSRHRGRGHQRADDPFGADVRDTARHLPQVLRPRSLDRRHGPVRRGGRRHRRPVHRRARHPADPAHVPHRWCVDGRSRRLVPVRRRRHHRVPRHQVPRHCPGRARGHEPHRQHQGVQPLG
jgi:DNA-directed RNA polymerase subunit beta'